MLRVLNYLEFESPNSFLRVQKFGWKILGFWIANDEVTQLQLLFLFLQCLEVIFYGIFQIWFIYENRQDLVVAFDAVTPLLSTAPIALRFLILTWHRCELKHSIDYLEKALINATGRELEINARANQKSSILLGMLSVLSYFTIFFYLISPVVRDLIRLNNGMERLYDLPFKSVFPFDYKFTPAYEMIYIINICTSHIAVAAVCGGDGLVYGLCFQLAAQFKVVSMKLSELIEEEIGLDDGVSKLSKEQNDRILKKLAEIVDLHNEAVHCCKLLSRAFWKNILMIFVCSSIIICICSLMIMQSSGIDTFIYISYFGAYIVLIFTYCVSGNELISASTSVNEAVYDFLWYRCDARVRKTILMIMIRAQSTVNIDIPFFEVSLETFAWIIRLGGSFITLIQTFI